MDEKIQQLFIDYAELKMQVGILVSRAESERDTQKRANDRHSDKANDLIELVEKTENAIMDILYGKDRISGMIVELDRLKQESEERKKTKQNIIALWIAVIVLVAGKIYDLITKK